MRNLNEHIEIYLVYYLQYGDKRRHGGKVLENLGFHFSDIKGFEIFVPLTNWQRIKGIFSKLPPGAHYMENTIGRPMRNYVEKLVKEKKIDIIHLWSPNLAYSFNRITQIPKILTAGDSFSLIHKSFASDKKFPYSLYHRIVSSRFAKYEHEIYPNYQAVIFFSARDKEAANLPDKVKQYIFPIGVDADIFPLKVKEKKGHAPTFVFHGFFGHYPNIESAEFLINTIGPHLCSELGEKGFKIWLIGKGAKELWGQFDFPWLEVFGYVNNLPELLLKADLYLAPVFSGAGMKNKVLEAMAAGLPVIGTKEAFAGIDIKDGIQGIIAEPEDFTSQILKLVSRPDLCEKIGFNARKLVVEKYSWKAISEKYYQLYEDLLS